MTGEHVTIGLFVLAGLGLLSVWTSGARTGRNAERAVREVTRLTGTAGRTLVTAAVIVGVQWAVIATTSNPIALGAALGVPALFAGVTVARLVAVTEVVRTVPRGGRR
jgi:hypothetical protein